LNAVASSISVAPAVEARLHDLNISVSTWVDEVIVIGTRSNEVSIFLLILGALVWGAGQFRRLRRFSAAIGRCRR
jgi:hypothetical protein